ncbi:MAG: hypothetical protein U0531_02665 [Dehalococcoidia bacterium]
MAAAAPWPAALLPPALILGAPLLFSARWRYLFLIFGGLATLQSSQALTPTKLAYLAGVGVALAAILCRYGRLERTPAAVAFRPVVLAFTLLFALVALSAVVAETRDTLFTNWLRDAAPTCCSRRCRSLPSTWPTHGQRGWRGWSSSWSASSWGWRS